MWVFTKHGFVAVVQHNALPGHFQVKSRVVDPLENLWPEHDIEVIDWADYRFRITMPKSDTMKVLEAQIADVTTPASRHAVRATKTITTPSREFGASCTTTNREWRA